MRYSEIIDEADSRLKAINTQLDTLNKRLHNLGSDSSVKDSLKRQKKKLQIDKSRHQMQVRQRDLESLE